MNQLSEIEITERVGKIKELIDEAVSSPLDIDTLKTAVHCYYLAHGNHANPLVEPSYYHANNVLG